jgi:hypothetical protein
VSDEVEFSMSVPLDRDGFLRRECPTCEREFKWFSSPEGEGTPVPAGGYFCPYCAIQAEPGAWFTKAQTELMQSLVMRDVVGPELDGLKRAASRLGRASGGLIEARIEFDQPDEPEPLTEIGDMRRVDFGCHPGEPVKVLDDWGGTVHCLVCATPAS